MMANRRDFLRELSLLAVAPVVLQGNVTVPQEPAAAGQGETGSLRDPVSAGPSRARVTARDNDAYIMEVEKRLRCTCGCTLDIYTCRTTDFTCTYSPELHKEVVALHDSGLTADQIMAAFVDKYGEKMLMAPKPEGFNYAGYLVPGALLLLIGGGLFAFLRRRSRIALTVPAGSRLGGAVAGVPAMNDELARLEQALRESEQ